MNARDINDRKCETCGFPSQVRILPIIEGKFPREWEAKNYCWEHSPVSSQIEIGKSVDSF